MILAREMSMTRNHWPEIQWTSLISFMSGKWPASNAAWKTTLKTVLYHVHT